MIHVSFPKNELMIFESVVVLSSLYTYWKERQEKQEEKVVALSNRLTKSPARYTKERLSVKEQVAEILAPFTDAPNSRNQGIEQIEKREEEKEIEQNLRLSTAMLGVSIVGLAFPPLQIVSLFGLLWASKGIYKAFYRDLVEEGKVTGLVVDTIALTTILAMGHFVLTAIGEMMYYAGQKLLLKTEHRSTQRLVNLFGEKPKQVWLVMNDIEVEIPFEQLKKGDIISLHAGEMIPIDGQIVKGFALVNQQSLTGEEQPVQKEIGDQCYASTFIIEGSLHVELKKAGKETVVAQIETILQNTTNFTEVMVSKGKDTGDKAAPAVLAVSASAGLVKGAATGAALVNANFGYILELVSPMMVLNFLTITSQEGILVKDGRSLELLHKVDTVVFDKTGTLTLSQPHVGRIHPFNGYSENELLTYAAAAEYRQTHPIALAIIQEAEDRGLKLPTIDKAKYEVGYGIKVKIEAETIHLGSLRFMEMEGVEIPQSVIQLIETAQEKGFSLVQLAIDRELAGILELHPTIRPEAKSVIRDLQAHGKTCYIISGDNELPTRHLARQLGIKHYFAEVLPKDKADFVTSLQKQNKTICFIGDGINDTIALKKADVSISIRGAATIATDTAQIVLMTESLKGIPLLFLLGNQFEEQMTKNVNTAIIPAAAAMGGIIFLNFGVAAAVLSSLVSLTVGIGNSIEPMVTYQQAKQKRLKESNKVKA